jgi:hypothetical protein
MLLECAKCEALVNAELLTQYTTGEEEFGPDQRISFLKCPKCGSPFLAAEDNIGFWDAPFQLHPPLSRPVSKAVPSAIKNAFEEASRSFKAKAYTATALMCRKTLEGICTEHGATGRNLQDSLQSLKDGGVIDSRLFEWADALRLFGNEAAHDVNVSIDREDASDMLVFTNALLEYVFTFRDRFNEFMERRKKAASA